MAQYLVKYLKKLGQIEFHEPILAPRATLATNLRPNVILYLLPSVSQMYPLPIEPNRVSDHGTEE